MPTIVDQPKILAVLRSVEAGHITVEEAWAMGQSDTAYGILCVLLAIRHPQSWMMR